MMMMQFKWNACLVLMLMMALSLSASAHVLDSQPTSVRDVFSEMPDSLLPYLTRNNRLDLLDFMESNMKAEVRNRFEGLSEMTSLTDSCLHIQLNDASTVDIILLSVEEPIDSASQIVCILQTFCNRESVLSFYSMTWRQLPMKHYMPIPMESMRANWDNATQTLTLTADMFTETVALEEQNPVDKTLIKLGWASGFYNKY